MKVTVINPLESDPSTKRTFNFLIDGEFTLSPELKQQPNYKTYSAAYNAGVKRAKQLQKKK